MATHISIEFRDKIFELRTERGCSVSEFTSPSKSIKVSDIIRLLLDLSPRNDGASSSKSHVAKYTVEDDEADWMIEMLIILLQNGDAVIRQRVATLLGLIGGDRAVSGLSHAVGDSCADVHWAAVAALRQLGHASLLAEWNYR